jgi:enamine deaminase RidA (YjgF/YER057c/UK114 family)
MVFVTPEWQNIKENLEKVLLNKSNFLKIQSWAQDMKFFKCTTMYSIRKPGDECELI